MKIKNRSANALQEKARRGFRGYPVVTIAFYGPDNERASKVAVALVPAEEAEPTALERWFSPEGDIRNDMEVAQQISSFIQQHQAKSVTMVDRILGCPHEGGVDYPEGEMCRHCPFWAHRDRWTGETVH